MSCALTASFRIISIVTGEPLGDANHYMLSLGQVGQLGEDLGGQVLADFPLTSKYSVDAGEDGSHGREDTNRSQLTGKGRPRGHG